MNRLLATRLGTVASNAAKPSIRAFTTNSLSTGTTNVKLIPKPRLNAISTIQPPPNFFFQERGYASTPKGWGSLIPSPSEKTSKAVATRPQYKRFDRGNGSRGGRGGPIWLDKRYQVVGGVMATGGGLYYVTHLERVPMTNRRRFMDVSVEQEAIMSQQSYQEVMRQYHGRILPQNHSYTQYVKKIASRIVRAAGMTDLAWEFHVIDSDEKNAFVLPGGKVFVFTGILPIAKNENGLATVLGHEIAHQMARHSAEKLSFAKIVMVLGLVVAVVFDPSYTVQRLVMELGMMLPFSRKCESEADEIGLQLMAQACFDPRESTAMWTRMTEYEKEQGGAGGLLSSSSLSFLNTHPASSDRIKQLEGWMPKALEVLNKSDCSEMNQYADAFRRARQAAW